MAGGALVFSPASWVTSILLLCAGSVHGLGRDAVPGLEISDPEKSGWRSSDLTVNVCTNPVGNFALRGVDVVAYFSLEEDDEAVTGSAEFASTISGYRFLFASAENKALFEANPSAYIPKYGGFCGAGIAEESIWNKFNIGPPSNPDVWLITSDQKLFLFRLDEARTTFKEDILGNTEAGDARWREWFGHDVRNYPLDTSCFCSRREWWPTNTAVCECPEC